MIKKVLVIGSGPIVIGQAAEFDYSGTQACLALREEGIKSVVVNPNPATIQTDKEIADVVYLEALTVESLAKIIAKERPDGLLATVGGQTGLNLAIQLEKADVLRKYQVSLLGTGLSAISKGEDRQLFSEAMQAIDQPVLPSLGVTSVTQATQFAKSLGGFPILIRSAYTLGGTGSGIADNQRDLEAKVTIGLKASPIGQVLVEKSVQGWGEFEYEIVRDRAGNSVCICNMENINPMGVHTGDSIVVAPSQTLSDRDHQKLRTAALAIVEALDIQGGCNVQFAFDYHSGKYYVIEVNPRLSRSSALASKATGYPIARVATKIALGQILPEIMNNVTGKTAFFEPSLDYVVIKIPRWPFDKFPGLNREVGVSMKSTGEVMAIGRSFEEAVYKGLMSLDSKESMDLSPALTKPTSDLLWGVMEVLKNGMPIQKIASVTHIHPWFLQKIKNLTHMKGNEFTRKLVYKMVDTCAGEFPALTPYFYSTSLGGENEASTLSEPKVVIIGAGPIRIGQGIEFDYMTVHAVKALQEEKIKSVVINNNPETVSTDYLVTDRLYFEPLVLPYVKRVLENEKNNLRGVICQFGGQTALNLAEKIETDFKVKVLGTSAENIKLAEDRALCSHKLSQMGLQVPAWTTAKNQIEVLSNCKKLGYPVMIRPSYVLAGEGMIIARNEAEAKQYRFSQPVLVDQFIDGAVEVDVDLISDGQQTKAFVLEQLEPVGVHSGDSTSVYPSQHLASSTIKRLQEIAVNVSREFNIIGLGNIQVAIKDNQIYILEINPRASRTIPFLSKAIDVPLVKIATKILLGHKLSRYKDLFVEKTGFVAIKKPIFSFHKLPDLSVELGPVMKSTGEVMAIAPTFEQVMAKLSTI